jgi:hypothetical protein
MEYDKTYYVEEVYETMDSRQKSISIESDLDSCCSLSEIRLFFNSLVLAVYDDYPEWVEIDRPLNTPIVDLKSLNLMKVALRFLVAVPFDGINVSVDNDIRTLRTIANSSDPVSFINMDRMLTNPFNVSRSDSRRTAAGFFFRVADMSIQSIRRNLRNEITSAEVSMTLQETANPPIRAIYFAPISYSVASAPSTTTTKKTTSPAPTTYRKITESINLADARNNAVRETSYQRPDGR